MIGYVTLGTNDIARAAAFYDALLGPLGAARLMDAERFITWSCDGRFPGLSVTLPYDHEPATVGNGVMVAIHVGSRQEVDAIYARAMNLGAKDEGAPGPRGEHFYAGYFRDLDGNKLNAFSLDEPAQG